MATRIPDDPFSPDDNVAQVLAYISREPVWNNNKKKLLQQLRESILKDNYLIFHSDFRVYKLQNKGTSGTYNIPLNQRGALKKFRGKRIRLICLDYSDRWRGYAGREFAAKNLD
jgi:hypothetical protein